MKSIVIPNMKIYEFECDTDLMDRAYQAMLSSKIEWFENPGSEPGSMNKTGYLNKEHRVSWYHDELFNWMQSCFDEVTKETVKLPLGICDSWITKTEYKQHSNMHDHMLSVICGLLYFTDHEGSNTVFEYTDHNRERMGRFLGDSRQGRITFTPKKGKFLIFPADIFHMIQSHNELKKTRYTLAVNTFFNGTLDMTHTGVVECKLVTVKDRYLRWKAS